MTHRSSDRPATPIPSLSIIVTVYSETFSLQDTVKRLVDNDRGYIKEIILTIHPKSSDECLAICHQLSKDNPLIVLHHQQQTPGVGWALREGMAIAQYDYIALLSADLETEPEAVDRMMRKIEATSCDVVIGNRWLEGGGFSNYDSIKLVLNWMCQKVFKVLYWTKLGDLTYGFKILSREIARSIPWEGTLHEIYIETTVRPLRRGYKIDQVPTVWIGRKEGSSQNSFVKNFRYVKLACHVLLKDKRTCPN